MKRNLAAVGLALLLTAGWYVALTGLALFFLVVLGVEMPPAWAYVIGAQLALVLVFPRVRLKVWDFLHFLDEGDLFKENWRQRQVNTLRFRL